MRFAVAEGIVREIRPQRFAEPRVVDLVVEVDGERRPAIAYPALVGDPEVGGGVLLNRTAAELGLGTGGFDIVVACLGTRHRIEGGGHIMKLRYTPHQIAVEAIEEHAAYREIEHRGLDGARIVVGALHSHLAPFVIAMKAVRPQARCVYIMTDEASLCAGMSRILAILLDEGTIERVITCGQAFGGTDEAVTREAAMLFAHHVLGVPTVFVAIGPGVAGTGTALGHGGLAQGVSANAVTALGGTPVLIPRVSTADERSRHKGVSHHFLAMIERCLLGSAVVPIPDSCPEAISVDIMRVADPYGHTVKTIDLPTGVREAIASRSGLIQSMGRGFYEDPVFFEAAAAAGVLCAEESVADV